MTRKFLTTTCLGICWALFLAVTLACERPVEQAVDSELVLEPQEAVSPSGPPTTWRLVLQLGNDGRFQLLSATPKRGTVIAPAIAENREALLAGHTSLVEYTALDAAGTILISGLFLVPQTAVSEFQDLSVETRVRRREESLSNPTVKVSVPFEPGIVTVDFNGVHPDAEAVPEEWKRVPMGSVTLGGDGDGKDDPRLQRSRGSEEPGVVQ